MIKKLVLACLIALPAMAFAQKFGYVDTQNLLANLPAMKEVQTQLEATTAKYEAEFNNLRTELEKKYSEFQQMEESTPQAIKERRVQEINELEQKAQQFRTTAAQDIQAQQEKLMAPIQQQVMTAIQSVGSEGGYTFIFEGGQMLYTGADVVDVTNAVKTKLGIK
ncbi:MAG: OmpH family outer membrane protein [Paramuribaculum sp.]|nr:OmpH family outer membrane protein [Paramuribaculum sp.]MDE6384502.1 OmpH family outer membrane protein [Paramuribaculum sp.]MDE6782915.1 OmpH family outer membrane protein [Paramuribaculum sp.]